jgi:hypothetical protein
MHSIKGFCVKSEGNFVEFIILEMPRINIVIPIGTYDQSPHSGVGGGVITPSWLSSIR